MAQLTEGQYRVGVTFNPSNDPMVDKIKIRTAELIDLLTPLSDACGVGWREASHAMTVYEDAAMWAVKAVTKRPNE